MLLHDFPRLNPIDFFLASLRVLDHPNISCVPLLIRSSGSAPQHAAVAGAPVDMSVFCRQMCSLGSSVPRRVIVAPKIASHDILANNR